MTLPLHVSRMTSRENTGSEFFQHPAKITLTMPVFVYHGQSRQGRRQRGEIFATDRQDAARVLRKQDIVATSIREKSAPVSLTLFSLRTRRVKPRELVVFTLQLATLVKAGVPLL